MTKNHDYNTPQKGALDWDVPVNENFQSLDVDVEIRDLDANRADYAPVDGAKFFATDRGTVYEGDGSSWTVVGYVTTSGFAGSSHYVNYGSGLSDEEITKFYLESGEQLEVMRISAPMKGVSEGTTDSNVKLTVWEGGTSGSKLVEVDGNGRLSTETVADSPWIATSSPVTVNVSTGSSTVDMAPGVWISTRRR